MYTVGEDSKKKIKISFKCDGEDNWATMPAAVGQPEYNENGSPLVGKFLQH